jgi:hypothetical protein
MSIQASRGDQALHSADRERFQRLRRTVVQRLQVLEAERARLLRGGHPEQARGALRAFREVP